MSFVAVAVGGSALLGIGSSIYSGEQQKSGAQGASGAMIDAYGRAQGTTTAAGRDTLAYLDPYRQYGLNAGSTLQSMLYSPEQRMAQMKDQQAQLEGEVARLKAGAPRWETYQVLTGKNASERRAAMFTQEHQVAQQKIAEAQAKLNTFNKQFSAAQEQAARPAPKPQESAWYQFQADLLNRSMDRSMAAQGLTGSGAALEERRRGLIELGAGETERQFARLSGLYNTGANVAGMGANAIMGTGQNLANQQIGLGQAQAQGIQGVAGANAGMATNITNSLMGGVGMGLQANQFNKLMSANEGRALANSIPNTGSSPVATQGGSGIYRGTAGDYLINPPR